MTISLTPDYVVHADKSLTIEDTFGFLFPGGGSAVKLVNAGTITVTDTSATGIQGTGFESADSLFWNKAGAGFTVTATAEGGEAIGFNGGPLFRNSGLFEVNSQHG